MATQTTNLLQFFCESLLDSLVIFQYIISSRRQIQGGLLAWLNRIHSLGAKHWRHKENQDYSCTAAVNKAWRNTQIHGIGLAVAWQPVNHGFIMCLMPTLWALSRKLNKSMLPWKILIIYILSTLADHYPWISCVVKLTESDFCLHW